MASPFDALDGAAFSGLTLWKTATGWQASVSVDRQSWHVKQGATPSEALLACLGAESAPVLPPLPY